MSIAEVISWKFNDQPGMTCREVDGVVKIVEFPGGIPSQAEQDQWTFEYKKHIKIVELRDACKAHIFAGFDSDALGTVHRYPLSQTDQANNQKAETAAMKNADTVGWTRIMQCIDSDGVAAYRPHTAKQVLEAIADIEEGSEKALLKLQDLLRQVKKAETEDDLNKIVW